MKANNIVLMFILIGGLCVAQTTQNLIFSDQRIARPLGLREIKAEEFGVDISRLQQYPNGVIYADQQTLVKLGNYLKNDKTGKMLWQNQCKYAADVLNRWDFKRSGFGAERYIYNLYNLEDLSLIYLFSGHKELGQFITAHIKQITKLPIEFWVHAELRKYNPAFVTGELETAACASGMGGALSIVGILLTKEERAEADKALRGKGLIPMLNWMQKPLMHNYSAVISSASIIAASYLKDEVSKEFSRKVLSRYLNETIENDGSYGEGAGYFSYPIGSLFSGILCLSQTDRESTFSKSGLKYSGEWLAYQYFFNTDKKGNLQPHIVHFGDNSYHNYPSTAITQILISIYQQPIAKWLNQKFERTLDIKELLLKFSTTSVELAAKSPKDLNLPLTKCFESGDFFMRSTWDDNGIVLASRSGDGSRIKFWHQRAELNSICMGAYGEYMVVSPGSSSYRNENHYLYDFSTCAANTITIDDRNQLFPTTGKNKWSEHLDNSHFWEFGTPKAVIQFSQIGQNADVIVNEAAEAYAPKMKYVKRTFCFVKNPGYFVIMDEIETQNDDSKHKFSARLHLNNEDGKIVFNAKNKNHWSMIRPLANLEIFVFSDKKMDVKIGKGYMNGPGRDYSPNGKYEGKLGSSVEMEIYNLDKTNKIKYYTVLYPTKKGMKAPKVSYSVNNVQVGNDKISFIDGACIVDKNGKKEEF